MSYRPAFRFGPGSDVWCVLEMLGGGYHAVKMRVVGVQIASGWGRRYEVTHGLWIEASHVFETEADAQDLCDAYAEYARLAEREGEQDGR